ncbi:hypothetical protein V6U90_27845 [Micromonospora sp. CPCC 206060]|uniref:hypothetical protein n=1 Tax=Micromonospora sp. CPCC 206060 TaxID=3122406 RepID=UPI002FF1633F
MTDRADVTPDPGALNFRLWLPRWDSNRNRLRCRFQATTTGLTQLNEGNLDCMTQFLADLGQTDADIVNWSIKRYRTTYFSNFPNAENWEDRLTLAWEVEIQTDKTTEPENAGTHAPGPHGSQAYDTTFQDEDEDWERTQEHVLVIAGTAYGLRPNAAHLNLPEIARSVNTEVFEGMAALDLGELDFPDGLSQVDAALAHCRSLGLRTNWKD